MSAQMASVGRRVAFQTWRVSMQTAQPSDQAVGARVVLFACSRSTFRIPKHVICWLASGNVYAKSR